MPASTPCPPQPTFPYTRTRTALLYRPQFGPKVEVQRSSGLTRQVSTLDLGVGLAFEVDTAELQPQASTEPNRLPRRNLATPAGGWLAGWLPCGAACAAACGARMQTKAGGDNQRACVVPCAAARGTQASCRAGSRW